MANVRDPWRENSYATLDALGMRYLSRRTRNVDRRHGHAGPTPSAGHWSMCCAGVSPARVLSSCRRGSCRRPERICSTLSVATPRWTEGPGQHPRVSRECASLRDSCLAGRFGGRRGACRCVRSKSRAESLLEHPGRTELRAGGVYLHAGQRGDGCVAPDQGFHGPDEWPRCGLRAHPRPMGPVREARPDRALRLAFGQRPRWQDRAANERFPDSPIPVSGFP